MNNYWIELNDGNIPSTPAQWKNVEIKHKQNVKTTLDALNKNTFNAFSTLRSYS